MNTYYVTYTYQNGFSHTVLVQAANRVATYEVCKDILPDFDKIVSIHCELERPMKFSNYFYISYCKMYGMHRGMYTGGCLDSTTLEDAKEIARTEAYDVVTGYDCIMSDIHDNLNEEFGYDETPEDPDEEYLDALEDAIEDECEYSLYEITPEGEEHRDEMEANYESYENYVKAGWLIPIDERPFEFYWAPDSAI